MFSWPVVLANNFQLPSLTHESVCICTKKHMAKWLEIYNIIQYYNVQIGYTAQGEHGIWHQSLATKLFPFGILWLIVFRLKKSCLGWRYHTKTTTPSIAISKVSSSHFSSEDPWAPKLIFTFLSLKTFLLPPPQQKSRGQIERSGVFLSQPKCNEWHNVNTFWSVSSANCPTFFHVQFSSKAISAPTILTTEWLVTNFQESKNDSTRRVSQA